MTKWGVRLFAGFWKRLSGLADIRLFATRYLVNLVGLVEIISLPVLWLNHAFSAGCHLSAQDPEKSRIAGLRVRMSPCVPSPS